MTDHQPAHAETDRTDLDAVDAMTDRIAAQLFWKTQPTWNLDTREEIEQLAEQLTADGREPTEHDLNRLDRANRRDAKDLDDFRYWLSSRKAVRHFGIHDASLVGQVMLVRATDIIAAAAITAFACAVSNGAVDLLRSMGTFLRHLV